LPLFDLVTAPPFFSARRKARSCRMM
jgi:hypothetical protein